MCSPSRKLHFFKTHFSPSFSHSLPPPSFLLLFLLSLHSSTFYKLSVLVGCSLYPLSQLVLLCKGTCRSLLYLLAAGVAGGGSFFLVFQYSCWLCTELGAWSIEVWQTSDLTLPPSSEPSFTLPLLFCLFSSSGHMVLWVRHCDVLHPPLHPALQAVSLPAPNHGQVM